MQKFSTAATKSSDVLYAPPARPAKRVAPSVGLLNVPYSTFAGASDPHKRVPPRLVRPALPPLRDEQV